MKWLLLHVLFNYFLFSMWFGFDHQGLCHRFSRDGTRPILVHIFIPDSFSSTQNMYAFSMIARHNVVAVSPYKIRIKKCLDPSWSKETFIRKKKKI